MARCCNYLVLAVFPASWTAKINPPVSQSSSCTSHSSQDSGVFEGWWCALWNEHCIAWGAEQCEQGWGTQMALVITPCTCSSPRSGLGCLKRTKCPKSVQEVWRIQQNPISLQPAHFHHWWKCTETDVGTRAASSMSISLSASSCQCFTVTGTSPKPFPLCFSASWTLQGWGTLCWPSLCSEGTVTPAEWLKQPASSGQVGFFRDFAQSCQIGSFLQTIYVIHSI